MTNEANYNAIYYDCLKEINNIGVGSAVSSLSVMLNQKITMDVPVLKFIEFKDIPNLMGDPSALVVATLSHFKSDINGSLMFIMDAKTAKNLSNALLRTNDEDYTTFSSLELDAINEIGNILFSSYSGALSIMTNKKVTPALPFSSTDMAGAILSVPAIEFGIQGDNVLFVESVFKSSEFEFNGYLLLIPDEESFQAIINSLM